MISITPSGGGGGEGAHSFQAFLRGGGLLDRGRDLFEWDGLFIS